MFMGAFTAWKVSKYGVSVFSRIRTEYGLRIHSEYGKIRTPYSLRIRENTDSVFTPNTGKYGPEKTPYLDTFHAVLDYVFAVMMVFLPLKTLAWKLDKK